MENSLKADKCALVLVDMQKLSVSAFAGSNPDLLENTLKAVDFCHERQIPVIYTRLERRPDLKDQRELITDVALANAGSPKGPELFLGGSPDCQLVEEIAPGPEDFIVVKRRMGAFYGSELELYLRALNVDTLLVGGVATEFGVEGTVRVARDMDFNVVVLSDCCATRIKEVDEFTYKYIFPAMSRVMTLEKVWKIMG